MKPLTNKETKRRISYHMRMLRGDRSLAEVARCAMTYPTTVKQIEDEERMPGLGLLTRIAAALHADVSDLISPIDYNAPPPIEEEENPSPIGMWAHGEEP